MSQVRVHLGCGLTHLPGWVNLDRHITSAADLLADALLLPLPDRSVGAIEARQLLEHLGYVGARYALCEWARVLVPGGSLCLETPDRTPTLRAAADPSTTEWALPWLFGEERPGQTHRYLFTAGELKQLAAEAGFEELTVEDITRRPARPTLRLTARRAADTPAIRFTTRLHRAFVTSGIVDPMNAPRHLAELETVCQQAAQLVGSPSVAALNQLVSLSARYSPRVAACILNALPDPASWPALELAQVSRLVAELEAERFTARLACRWRGLSKQPGAAAPWATMEREVSLYLGARLCPGQGLDGAREAIDKAVPSQDDLGLVLFCRPALADLARQLTARGVRAVDRGDLVGAERLFETALGYAPDALWPRWNLARAHVQAGRLLDAITAYEGLQAGLPTALRPALERELDSVTGRCRGLPAFVNPLAGPHDLLEDLR